MTTYNNLSLFASEQFRMHQLQVFNWGTFSDIHTIAIAERGFLFVGRSGAGKSTLLDAFSALLTPPRWVDFNAAAREADRSGRDRSLVTYIRGAWAEQKDDELGEIATRYLRTGTTWSALALSYRNASGQAVTLVQLFWLRGNSNGGSDVKRQYLVFERPFDLHELEEFNQSNFDVRKLKSSFPQAFIRDEFRPYSEYFCRLLGIENEMALRLLHKTQSAKNLGDLNTFLRDFMLDKPQTFEVADRLVMEFGELNAAHQAVVTARDQVQTLAPARDQYQQLQRLQIQTQELEELQQGVNSYRELQRIELLKQHLIDLAIQESGMAGEVSAKQQTFDNQNARLRDLQQRHRDLGGDRIEQLEAEKKDVAAQRDERIRKRDQAQEACTKLDWSLPNSPQGFAELVGKARAESENWQQQSDANRDNQFQLSTEKKSAEDAFTQVRKEIEALKRQPSNIPADMLELRSEIATSIGISEKALPFVGELIEVKAEEIAWQGAIERVLHGFALSLLVDERHYAALANHLNSTNLGRRLVYYRTSQQEHWQTKPVVAHSLILKLTVKEEHHTAWLQNELRQRFDYACVDSIQAFRTAERAITKEGQVKHNKTRHEKDDRSRIDDRRHWVLGFNNREKLALFEQQAQELAETITRLSREINQLADRDKQRAQRVFHCQALINLQWQEIDPAPLLTRIADIDQALQVARQGNASLQEISKQIEQQQQQLDKTQQELIKIKAKLESVRSKIEESQSKLDALQQDPTLIPLTPHQQQGLEQRFASLPHAVQLENLDKLTTSVVNQITEESKAIQKEINHCQRVVENHFAEFIRNWPAESEGLDATVASAVDLFAKLTRLEADGLPAYEQRFFELLQNQSHQNLAALATHLNNARKAILERMGLVNESLRQAPFNQTADQRTYLHIDATDRQLPEVREFKQEVAQVLSNAWSEECEFAEARFITLRKLVERLASQDPEQKRWRESVLDVRQHVEFIGREMDESGIEIEVYRSGAGKSGGQRQKLATTCLAAALRYQLGGNERGFPMYAPVVLDEAFDKADNEFTTLAMNIFANFGFQMIVATPLKSVMTLEPFIGGACFVDITDRRVSSVLLIEYDDDQQKLKLSKQMHAEAAFETS
jgi:uncharacterized protein YPO0396